MMLFTCLSNGNQTKLIAVIKLKKKLNYKLFFYRFNSIQFNSIQFVS